jgi:hypothetical protein
VGHFGPCAETADKTGWAPFSKRAEGRSGTRLGNWGAPVLKAVLGLYVKHSQKRAATRFEKGLSPFWRPSSISLKNTNISSLLSLNAIRERVGPSDKVALARRKMPFVGLISNSRGKGRTFVPISLGQSIK